MIDSHCHLTFLRPYCMRLQSSRPSSAERRILYRTALKGPASVLPRPDQVSELLKTSARPMFKPHAPDLAGIIGVRTRTRTRARSTPARTHTRMHRCGGFRRCGQDGQLSSISSVRSPPSQALAERPASHGGQRQRASSSFDRRCSLASTLATSRRGTFARSGLGTYVTPDIGRGITANITAAVAAQECEC